MNRPGPFIVLTSIVMVAIVATVIALVSRHIPLAARRHPAAVTVDRLLDLRRVRSTDASAYAPFFVSLSLAEELARDSAETSKSPRPPVPRWSEPYVSTVATPSAEVVVVWRRDAGSSKWAAATVFVMTFADGRWAVRDAREILDARRVPRPAHP